MGGEFSSRRNFLSLSNSLYEFFLGHSMNISKYKPPGGLYLEGRFNGAFIALQV